MVHDPIDMVVHRRIGVRTPSTILWTAITFGACSIDKVSTVDEGSTTEISASSTASPPVGTTAAETAAPDGTTEATDSTGPATDETTGPIVGCGNGLVEPGEQCDGEDHAGSTCLNLFGYGGELSCTDTCAFELLGCFPPGMILIPGGSFEMGSDAFFDDERPARQVEVDTFYIDAVDVTVEQYADCMDAGECSLPMQGEDCNWGEPGRDDHPINCVTWDDADAYCAWTGGVITKRLPTEAEWEKAARGDDARLWPWGDVPLPSCTHVVMNEGAGGGCGAYSSLPVGSRPLGNSPYGVQDMSGSIWNWVADWYAVYDVAETDNPTGPPTGLYRIIRGGGWDTSETNWFRTSARNPHLPSVTNRNIGFRCAQAPPTMP
jgi:formylglycine-generating enzyme